MAAVAKFTERSPRALLPTKSNSTHTTKTWLQAKERERRVSYIAVIGTLGKQRWRWLRERFFFSQEEGFFGWHSYLENLLVLVNCQTLWEPLHHSLLAWETQRLILQLGFLFLTSATPSKRYKIYLCKICGWARNWNSRYWVTALLAWKSHQGGAV